MPPQKIRAKTVNAGVDDANFPLRGSAILVFHDFDDIAIVVGDNAPIAGRVGEGRGNESSRGAGFHMRVA